MDIIEKVVDLDQMKLRYYKIGNGSPIVFFMGYGMTANFWSKELLNKLLVNHSLYLIDYPTTDSEFIPEKLSFDLIADKTVELMVNENHQTFKVLGWSMGGGVALNLATNYPNQIELLFLISPIMPTVYPSRSIEPIEKPKNFTELLHTIFSYNFYNYQEDQFDFYVKQILNLKDGILISKDINASMIDAIADWKSKEANFIKYKQLNIPCLFLIPEYENILDVNRLMEYINQYPKRTVVTIPNAGHAAFYQQPELIYQQIMKFIKSNNNV